MLTNRFDQGECHQGKSVLCLSSLQWLHFFLQYENNALQHPSTVQ